MNENIPVPPSFTNNGDRQACEGEFHDSLKKRIVELETELAKMTRQREETRRMLFELQDVVFPDDPAPTEDELLEERKTLTEISISDLIAELESRVGETGR